MGRKSLGLVEVEAGPKVGIAGTGALVFKLASGGKVEVVGSCRVSEGTLAGEPLGVAKAKA